MITVASLLIVTALSATNAAATSKPHLCRMENLVTFGDSYTDEGRLNYFLKYHKLPPIGQMLPPSNNTSSGGATWGRYVANAAGATLYDYAVIGAMCTSKTDSRYVDAIQAPYPSVLEYEILVFEQDIGFSDLYPDRRPDNTVYALWIGTNDLGLTGFLTDTQKKGTTISTFVDCIWETFDHIYKSGGRRFILLNQVPLEHAPLYADPSTGLDNHKYLENKTAYNVTEYTNKVREYTTSANTMFDYGVPFQLTIKTRWPGATVSIFDVHSLMMDVLKNPGEYLDAPANVTAPYHICLDTCVDSKEPKSSFMW
ncbi:Acetyl esterase [Tolypocladium capitatum]|uniref:Acetyl esterase n=1 Tax=Tolypocladium capitatum TaxID=45235 RepID=A0A2K3QF29_9HYPO|nr:Acetyl esterase [Tolypocladium capitatum]